MGEAVRESSGVWANLVWKGGQCTGRVCVFKARREIKIKREVNKGHHGLLIPM